MKAKTILCYFRTSIRIVFSNCWRPMWMSHRVSRAPCVLIRILFISIEQKFIQVGCVPPALPPYRGGLRDRPPEQKPPEQRPPCRTETSGHRPHLDRYHPGQRLPWTDRSPPPVNRITDRCKNITRPLVNRIADRCKNITFPQLRLRVVMNLYNIISISTVCLQWRSGNRSRGAMWWRAELCGWQRWRSLPLCRR